MHKLTKFTLYSRSKLTYKRSWLWSHDPASGFRTPYVFGPGNTLFDVLLEYGKSQSMDYI